LNEVKVSLIKLSYIKLALSHQWHHTFPPNEPWPLLGLFFIEDSQQISFYKVRLSASHPTPNLEDQASIFIPPRDRDAQLYARTLGSLGTSESPFPIPIYVGA
jgi:hypothetical protein